MDEQAKDLWDKIGEKLWIDIEKKWPYCESKNVSPLGWFIKEECGLTNSPNELTIKQVIDLLNRYLDFHILNSTKLTNKYLDLKKDIEFLKKLDYLVYLDWYISRGKIEFYFQENGLFNDLNQAIKKIKMHTNLPTKKVELLTHFSPDEQQIKIEIQKLITMELEKINNKWEPILKKNQTKLINI